MRDRWRSWDCGTACARRRVVEEHAGKAQQFVQERLEQTKKQFDEPLATRPGVERMLVELDGSEIRTGTLRPAGTDDKSPVRQRPKRIRAWVEVRVGLARPLDELEATHVAHHGPRRRGPVRSRLRPWPVVAHEGLRSRRRRQRQEARRPGT